MQRLVKLALAIAMLPSFYCAAQEGEQSAVANLPDGKAVFDQYIEATGGKERWSQIQSTMINGSMSVSGMTAPITIRRARPNKLSVNVKFENFGEVDEGSNGDIAWSVNPMQGASILDGKEKQDVMRRADFDEELHPEKYFKTIECTGVEDVDAKPCYVVEFTDMNDVVEKRFYDKESHLLIQVDAKRDTPLGQMDTTAKFSDYREIGGLKMAFNQEISVMGQTRSITYDDVELDVEFESDAFDPPEAIVKLLEKKAEKASEGE